MTAIAEFDTPFAARDRQSRNRAMVRGWLYLVLLVMFALFLVGGATRLTDSGLSITEWKPIHGVVPPLDGCRMAGGIREVPADSRIPAAPRRT